MLDISQLDLEMMEAMKGANVFDADLYPREGGDPISCSIAIDTLELADEFGVPRIHSGAKVTYLVGQCGYVSPGDYFLATNGRIYRVETKVPSQDPSMREAHCRVEVEP